MINAPDKIENEYDYLSGKSFKDIYTTDENPNVMKFYIEGIHCTGCLSIIENIPTLSDRIKSVTLNLSTKIADVIFDNPDSFGEFPSIARKLGYRAHPVKDQLDSAERYKEENKSYLYRIGVAGVCAGNIMLLSASIYAGAGGIFKHYFEIISFALALPVVIYCVLPFYSNVIIALSNKTASVDIPVVFVVLTGFLLSANNLLIDSGSVYFDSVTVFVFLLLVSRYFLRLIQGKISYDNDLFSSLFDENKVLRYDEVSGQYSYMPVQGLNQTDRILIKKGQRCPVDGRLLSASCVFNLSVLTGELIPQKIFKGSEVYAGSILETEEAEIDVLRTGNETRIGAVLENIKSNYREKLEFENFSRIYSTIFTIIVISISFTGFFILSGLYNTSVALTRIMSFALIACPCAFVFVLPLTIGLSLRQAGKDGFLIKDYNVFEKLRKTRNIYFDKTGTLSKGVFKILKWDKNRLSDSDISAILSMEANSEHPVARSIVDDLHTSGSFLQINCEPETVYTKGIKADVAGHFYEIYSDDQKLQNDTDGIVTRSVSIYKDNVKLSTIFLGEEIKGDAKELIEFLKSNGFEIYLLSGDKRDNVERFAQGLSIPLENTYYEKYPEEKIDIVRKSRNTIFIGDGLNDAGAMSASDISIAVQGSADQSLRISDVYLLNNEISSLKKLFSLGNATTQTVKVNSALSVTYNIITGALALMGFINPLAAAILMPISSLLLLLSSLAGTGSLGLRSKLSL